MDAGATRNQQPSSGLLGLKTGKAEQSNPNPLRDRNLPPKAPDSWEVTKPGSSAFACHSDLSAAMRKTRPREQPLQTGFQPQPPTPTRLRWSA
jgi:hypothetical protein